ncbi:MAG TPA: DNA-protecting protein DprA [Tissierellia bacterium]|nr:DNA-protecting protein DprA [Tissierellia bacterium]
MDLSKKDILIWLNSLNIGNQNIEKIISQVDDIRDIWYMTDSVINRFKNISSKNKETIIKNRNEDYLKKVLYILEEQNIEVVTIYDENYPKSLKNIYNKPLVLYIKGKILEEDEFAIAVVGSRKATSYGKWATEKFVKELVNLDITIVSGLATGIDSIAHKTALEYNGRTIAVLGNGLDIVYPNKNKELYKEIAKNGALITEYFCGVAPLPYNFPQRNRIISGLSLGVIIVEAKGKSGSLITAQHALEQGKEVFAVPGNINSIFSEGTNRLIKDGAKLIMDVEDIIEELYQLQDRLNRVKKENIDYSNLSELEISIVELIKEGPMHCDTIAMKTGMNIKEVNSILTILELKGIIKEIGGGIFALS